MTGPLGVRFAWGGLLVLAAIAAFLRVAPVATPSGADTGEPLNLPDPVETDQPAAEYGDSGVLVSARNPFDSLGEAWNPTVARRPVPVKTVKAVPAPTAPDGVKGMFRVPGVEGVFVADDFVGIGETVQGARVERVERKGVVFSHDRRSSVTWVNAEREQRKRSFEKMGLPMDGTREEQ